MKPLSVEIACLLGIQNKIQAVWLDKRKVDWWFSKCPYYMNRVLQVPFAQKASYILVTIFKHWFREISTISLFWSETMKKIVKSSTNRQEWMSSAVQVQWKWNLIRTLAPLFSMYIVKATFPEAKLCKVVLLVKLCIRSLPRTIKSRVCFFRLGYCRTSTRIREYIKGGTPPYQVGVQCQHNNEVIPWLEKSWIAKSETT